MVDATRVEIRYPHITSLYLNAGMAVYKGNNYFKFITQTLSEGFLAPLTEPKYNVEHVGVKSADGERGMCWGVNCLAPYIMVSTGLCFESVLMSRRKSSSR